MIAKTHNLKVNRVFLELILDYSRFMAYPITVGTCYHTLGNIATMMWRTWSTTMFTYWAAVIDCPMGIMNFKMVQKTSPSLYGRSVSFNDLYLSCCKFGYHSLLWESVNSHSIVNLMGLKTLLVISDDFLPFIYCPIGIFPGLLQIL